MDGLISSNLLMSQANQISIIDRLQLLIDCIERSVAKGGKSLQASSNGTGNLVGGARPTARATREYYGASTG